MFNVITIAPFPFTPDADQECQKKLEQYPADQLLIVDGLCEVDDSQLNSWLKLQSLHAADIAAAANALAEGTPSQHTATNGNGQPLLTTWYAGCLHFRN